MNKQQFMAMSLPYGLKCKCIYEDEITVEILSGCTCLEEQIMCEDYDGAIENVLPVLHPFSDLTKEIEHNGEKFVPIDFLMERYSLKIYQFINGEIYNTDYARYVEIEELPFVVVMQLIEWYFDIAGLIEKGEAIDVNTLPKNPYK